MNIFRLRNLVAMLCLCFISIAAVSQQRSDCMARVQSYYDAFAKIGNPKGKKVYHFKLIMDNAIKGDNGVKHNKANVSIFIGERNMNYFTDDVKIYQDEEDVFMVIKKHRTIIRSKSSLETDRDDKLKSLFSIQDSLLAHMEVIDCSEKIVDKDRLFIANLKFEEKINKVYQVKSIRMIFDDRSKQMKSVYVKYLPGQPNVFSKQQVAKIDLNSSKRFQKRAKDIFYSSNGTIKPAYAGYKIIDKRN